jgi:hypothetical protein
MTAVDFSTLVTAAVTGSVKIVASLMLALVAYLTAFRTLKCHIGERFSTLAGSAVSGVAGIGAYMRFAGH